MNNKDKNKNDWPNPPLLKGNKKTHSSSKRVSNDLNRSKRSGDIKENPIQPFKQKNNSKKNPINPFKNQAKSPTTKKINPFRPK
ncbi:hypothetical protein [Pseudalkalibacillus decolorationis]|uniref:hypothetical protein n=1 Tax=Pseudalkalibacillus decolorationis TaxID=163879 RepID=UPI0021481411|nr:hypothetical protein [Pseudalkalibacillus decolorationis]